MAVRIFIRRHVDVGKIPELMPLLKQLRVLALQQPAYISGETLKRVDIPGEYLVVSTWETHSAWQEWFRNPERQRIQGQVDALLGEKTEYAVYQHG